jgi:hypothetical protein
MILSKNNLLIHELSAIDKAIPVLNNVHIAADGSTVAANGKCLIAVSPVDEKLKSSIPLQETKSDAHTISNESIKEVLKNVPKDTMFGGLLEYCDTENGTFTSSDGKRKRKLETNVYQKKYIDYKKAFRRIPWNNKKKRIALNRKRLIKLLQTIDKICPDSSGEGAVYIEFTEENNVVLRSINHINGQRTIALMTTYKGIEGNWLQPDEWEKKLCQKKTAKKKVPKI